MPRSRAINRNDIDRAGRLALIRSFVDPHGLGELRPRRPVNEGIIVPITQVARGWGRGRSNCFHGGPGSHMLNHGVIPGVPFLMAQDQRMTRHGVLGIWRLKVVGQLRGLAQCGLVEVDMINISPGDGRRRCVG